MKSSSGEKGRARGRGRGWKQPRSGGSRRGGGPPLYQQHAAYLSNVRNQRGNYHGQPEHFNQMYRPHPNELPRWMQFRDRLPCNQELPPNYNTLQQGSHHRQEFLYPPSFKHSPIRASSPLPGSEEYMQRDISEKSAFLKRALKLEPNTNKKLNSNVINNSSTAIDNNLSSNNFINQSMCNFISRDGDFSNDTTTANLCDNPYTQSKSDLHDKCDEQTVTKSVVSPRRNKKLVKRQKQPEEILSVEEIHNRIINHIANLSHGKKINFLNQSGPSGYDIAVQQVTRQKRLELSKALRDICKDKFKESSSTSQVIESIIPDFDIKIEELPREVVEQLSSTLDEDIEGHVQNISVDPELMFQQAANMLSTMLDLDDADKNDFNYTDRESTLDNSNFEYPILQETDLSQNALENRKDPNYMETISNNSTQIQSSPEPSYDGAVMSSSAMNFDNIPTSCNLPSSNINSSLTLDFPTPPPVMYGVPPPPSLLECQQSDIEEFSFQNNIMTQSDHFNKDKRQYYSPGDISSENSLPPLAAFNETAYYSPRNTLSSPLGFIDLSMRENTSKSNYVSQSQLSSTLNIGDVNHVLHSTNHPFSLINADCKKDFNLNTRVATTKVSYNQVSKQLNVNQDYYPLNTTNVSDILLPPNLPILQMPLNSAKEDNPVHLENICVPPLPPTSRSASFYENSRLSNVLTKSAGPEEICLTQSNDNLNNANTNTFFSSITPESFSLQNSFENEQNEKLFETNSAKYENKKTIAAENEPLLKVRKDISVIKTISDLNDSCKSTFEEAIGTEGNRAIKISSELIPNEKEKEINPSTGVERLRNSTAQACSKRESRNDKQKEDEATKKMGNSHSIKKSQHKSNSVERNKDKNLTTKYKSRSRETRKEGYGDKCYNLEERNKERVYKSKSAERSERNYYDIHRSQRFDEEYRKKSIVNVDKYKKYDRDRSGDKHDSEFSEAHHYSKYEVERGDIHHSQRYYNDSYSYRSEHKNDYLNFTKYGHTAKSQYSISDSLNPKSAYTCIKHRIKHGKQHKKHSKKRKRHNRSAPFLMDASNSERHYLSKKHKHKSKHSDVTNTEEISTPKSNLKPLKERIQVLCDFKYDTKHDSSPSDYEDRKIQSEPVTPGLSKEPSPERCRSIEEINYNQEFAEESCANDLRKALLIKSSGIDKIRSDTIVNKLKPYETQSKTDIIEKQNSASANAQSSTLNDAVNLKTVTESRLQSPKDSSDLDNTIKSSVFPEITNNSENLKYTVIQENLSSIKSIESNSENSEAYEDNQLKVVECRKPEQRPWKSPGEKKFMMEHLQRNPQLEEIKINLMTSKKSNNDAIQQEIVNTSVPLKKIMEDANLELSPEQNNSKFISENFIKDKEIMEDIRDGAEAEVIKDWNKCELVSQEGTVPLVVNSTTESLEEIPNINVQDNGYKMKDNESKSHIELEKLNLTNTTTSVFPLDPCKSQLPSTSMKIESELPTTSSKTKELPSKTSVENSILPAESSSRSGLKSHETKTSSSKSNKNTKHKRSHSKTKEAEILHYAEVSSTSDSTTKYVKKSELTIKNNTKSKDPNKLKNETLDSGISEMTPVEAKAIDTPTIPKPEIATAKQKTCPIQIETNAEDDKDKKSSRRYKKHSSHKSDKHKPYKSTSTQISITTTSTSTQTQNTRFKNVQVQVDLLESKTVSTRSFHSQTDVVTIFEDIEETDDLQEKSCRKALKAVRRKKAVGKMLDLDKEIERLTKMRQDLYKILNADSDSDSSGPLEDHPNDVKYPDTSKKITDSKLNNNEYVSKLQSNNDDLSIASQTVDDTNSTQDSIKKRISHKKSRSKKSKKDQKITKKNSTVESEMFSEKSNSENPDTSINSKNKHSKDIEDVSNKTQVEEDNQDFETHENLADNKHLNVEKVKSDKLIIKIKGYKTKKNKVKIENKPNDTNENIVLAEDIQLTEEFTFEDTIRPTRNKNKKSDKSVQAAGSRRRQKSKTESQEAIETTAINESLENDQEIPVKQNKSSKKGRRRKKEVQSFYGKDSNINNDTFNAKQKSDVSASSDEFVNTKPMLKAVLKRKLEALEDEQDNDDKSENEITNDHDSEISLKLCKKGSKSSSKKIKNVPKRTRKIKESPKNLEESIAEHSNELLNNSQATPNNSLTFKCEDMPKTEETDKILNQVTQISEEERKTETSSQSNENLTEDLNQLSRSRKRKIIDSTELDYEIDKQNAPSQNKKTKKSKSELHADKEGGTSKKKKKYPFSGIKSGYTSRRRKSSSDTINKISPVLKSKPADDVSSKNSSLENDCKTSYVRLTRISQLQLEKINQGLFNEELDCGSFENASAVNKINSEEVIEVDESIRTNKSKSDISLKTLKLQSEDESNIEENIRKDEDYKINFKGFTGAILVVRIIESTVIAASDKGKILYFSLSDGKLTNTINASKFAITSLIITKRNDTNLIYAGSLDSQISILDFNHKRIIKIENIAEPVQCMEYAWNYIFIGSDRGSLIRYNVHNEKIEDTTTISDSNVLVMRATQEGPRKVLIVATRNAPACIRDALNGLLLRTLETPFSPTVYTLLLEKNRIYCGTSQHDILIYTFEDGQLVCKYEATKSKGVVCMQIIGNLLFAGCYNGNIYIYNTKDNSHLGTMNGPGGLMLSMEIIDNKIIVGTKSSNFRAWKIPQKYVDQM